MISGQVILPSLPKDLPIDFIKIDRSFIKGIDRSEKHLNLFKSITALAGSIGVEVVAEEWRRRISLKRS